MWRRGAAPGSRPSSFRRTTLGIQHACGAILDPLAGRLNGFALLQAMRPVLERRRRHGVRGHARAARAAGRRGGRSRRRTARFARARWCSRPTRIRPRSASSGAASCRSTRTCSPPRRLRTRTWARIGWGDWDGFSDDFDRIAFACRTPGGRLLFGGGGNPAYTYRFGGSTAIDVRPRRRGRALSAARDDALLPGARRYADRASLGRHARHHAGPDLLDGRRRRASQRLSRARLQRTRGRARAARRTRARRPLRRQSRSLARPARSTRSACCRCRPSRCAGSAIRPTHA